MHLPLRPCENESTPVRMFGQTCYRHCSKNTDGLVKRKKIEVHVGHIMAYTIVAIYNRTGAIGCAPVFTESILQQCNVVNFAMVTCCCVWNFTCLNTPSIPSTNKLGIRFLSRFYTFTSVFVRIKFHWAYIVVFCSLRMM